MVVWLAEIGYFLLMRSMEAAFLLVMIIQISVTSMGLSFSTDSSQSRRIYAKGTGIPMSSFTSSFVLVLKSTQSSMLSRTRSLGALT